MKYKVLIEETAESDLIGILSYIRDTLLEPETALQIYRKIKIEIRSLELMPFRYAPVQEEPYGGMGVRRIPVGNYSAFYIVNEKQCTVHIFRILYNRREWQNLL